MCYRGIILCWNLFVVVQKEKTSRTSPAEEEGRSRPQESWAQELQRNCRRKL
jgi:hypothetical protein